MTTASHIADTNPMLEVVSLRAGYGKVEVLKGLSLKVHKGQLVTMIGANGAGKTTLMRALSGMLETSGGTICLEGQDVTASPSFLMARLGLAHSPEGRRVFPTLPVDDNLQLGAFTRYTGARPKGDIRGDLDRAYGLFPILAERRRQLAGTLSGGEQQMLAMARALMLNPKVLLLDEPSMGLAPLLVAEVFRIIGRLKAEAVTMLLVEQFAAAALKVADYAYVLENGHLAAEGPAPDVARDPAVRVAYLGAAH